MPATIEDWQKAGDDLILKTWAGEIAWTETTVENFSLLKFIQRKRLGILRVYLTEYQGKAWRLYRHFIFTKSSAKSSLRLESMGKFGWVRRLASSHSLIKELFQAVEFRSWEIDDLMRREHAECGFLVRSHRNQRDYKGLTIVYQERDNRLSVYLEICSKGAEHYWGGTTGQVSRWTYPADAEIPGDQQAQIIDRISRWGEIHHLPIEFENGMTLEETKARLRAMSEASGFVVTENKEGGMTASRPSKKNSH